VSSRSHARGAMTPVRPTCDHCGLPEDQCDYSGCPVRSTCELCGTAVDMCLCDADDTGLEHEPLDADELRHSTWAGTGW
jgi:hypothetical protein